MATNNSLKQAMQQAPTTNDLAPKTLGVKALIKSEAVQKSFNDVLKDKATSFTTNVLSLVNNDSYLAQSEPMSIITGAMTAATLDLPLDKNLGYAYLVPFKDYKNGNVQKAQFILGYKGYIQLAQRSGRYKALNVTPVYEGELVSWNRLTEEIDFDPEKRVSDVVIGYCGHFELLNGFKKTVYWTKQEVEYHRMKHNKARDKKTLSGVWASDYDSMACKTVLRNLLSKWGILSIEMQTAEIRDERTMDLDTETNEIKIAEPVFEQSEGTPQNFDAETGEILEGEIS